MKPLKVSRLSEIGKNFKVLRQIFLYLLEGIMCANYLPTRDEAEEEHVMRQRKNR